MAKVRCNNCMNVYEEEDLVRLWEDNENDPDDKSVVWFDACPECKTDEYLTDEWVD